ncbi:MULTISPECIES: hypothetical protein [Deinococcus]|uniref:Uncharacterized protein n=1 Tax=Deinococcus rufus TaxID=2136097 RepID=A0ABV7ZDX2_9DEIO|nr:hypothetical protein [Deinococcus sp. AB2017081]WQE93662.1 hypothetical protein U2P90_09580 [Deinococcus sp. AB2017081]
MNDDVPQEVIDHLSKFSGAQAPEIKAAQDCLIGIGYHSFDLAIYVTNLTEGKRFGGSKFPVLFDCLIGISTREEIKCIEDKLGIALFPLGTALDLEIYVGSDSAVYLIDVEVEMYFKLKKGIYGIIDLINGQIAPKIKLKAIL